MSLIDKFTKDLDGSAFNRSFYQADLSFDGLVESLLMYVSRPSFDAFKLGQLTISESASIILNAIPEFQRNNDKWSSQMQVGYVLNVMRGMRGSPLMLYTVWPDRTKVNCKILDGLQRITALLRFWTDDNMMFNISTGEQISAGQLREDPHFVTALFSKAIPVRVYDFKHEIEAVKFYIEINENITHSQDDIAKAKDFLSAAMQRMEVRSQAI
jgi:hypothetical protein